MRRTRVDSETFWSAERVRLHHQHTPYSRCQVMEFWFYSKQKKKKKYHTWNSVLLAANLDDGSFFLSRVPVVLLIEMSAFFLPLQQAYTPTLACFQTQPRYSPLRHITLRTSIAWENTGGCWRCRCEYVMVSPRSESYSWSFNHSRARAVLDHMLTCWKTL